MKNSSTHVQLVNVSQPAQLKLGNCFGLLLFTGSFFLINMSHMFIKASQSIFSFLYSLPSYTLRDVISYLKAKNLFLRPHLRI